jgi:hypothetical protein
MKRNLLPVLSLLLAIAAASVAVAQSGNRDHPTPIDSNELKGVLNSDGGEFFYSFTAGPGDLTITVEVTSSGGTLAMPFELLGANAADSILCCEFAQAGTTGETGRVVKTVKIRSRRTVILHLTENQYGAGTFLVRFSGAVTFAGRSEPVQGGRIGYRGPDSRMGMPTNGTLLITMRDGSTKEIDLSLVRELSVRH